MILSEDQLTDTKAWVERFKSARDEIERAATTDEALRRAYASAFTRQLDDLQAQVGEYEKLRSGVPFVIRLTSLAELPIALIKGRIAAGLSQHDLAQRLSVQDNQVMRDEETEYESVSLSYLIQVAEALHLKIGTEISLPSRAA